MAENKFYLTTGPDPKGRGLMAIVTLGQPQRGDKNVQVLDVELVKDQQEAEEWFARVLKERPWETRQ